MKLRQRLVAILACVSFLLSGGLGAGAHVIICTESDGQVHFEMPFNRCCAAEEQEQLGEDCAELPIGSSMYGPDASLAAVGCDPCSDQLVGLDQEHVAPLRTMKFATEHQLHLPVLATLPPSTLCNDLVPSIGHVWWTSPVSARAPIETVILRR